MIYVVVLYIALTVLIGFISKKKSKNARAYHGANLGVLMCVVAGAGEWMGGTSTTGVSEYGYTWGISGAWYTIANGVGILVCAIFFAKLYRSLNTPTVPGIIGYYIGPKARMISSVILIFVMLVVGVSQMIAIGTLGKILFDIDISVSILVLGCAVILYTLFGGMVTVGYTNTLHLIVMYIGMIIAVFASMKDLGGMSTLKEALPESYFTLTNIGFTKVSSWIIASVLGACTAQAGIQPILAAKDEKTAVKSSIIIALVVAPFGILTALLGMIAKVQFPEMTSAKLALPVLMQSLPTGVAGFVMAAILAAILSTASPIFLSCGTLFTKDIYMKTKKSTKKDNELLVSRVVTAIAGLVCVVCAVLVFNHSAVLDIVYFAYSLRGSLFIILLFGIYCKQCKVNERSAIISMIVTASIGLIWVIYRAIMGRYPIANFFSETYATVLTALITMIFFRIINKETI